MKETREILVSPSLRNFRKEKQRSGNIEEEMYARRQKIYFQNKNKRVCFKNLTKKRFQKDGEMKKKRIFISSFRGGKKKKKARKRVKVELTTLTTVFIGRH